MSEICKAVLYCVALSTVVTGYSCGSVPAKHYYALINQTPRRVRSTPACDRPLVLAPVEAVSPYDSSKIVYRRHEYNIDFYHYRLWAAEPEDMLEELLSQKLAASNIFPGVEPFIHASIDHLALYVRIVAMEELDQGESWNARLSMSFVLKEPRDETVIWRHVFDRTEPVPEKTPWRLVKTLNGIYDLEVQKMLTGLEIFVAGYQGCRAAIGDARVDQDLPGAVTTAAESAIVAVR